ncbi:hypothetical protein L2E82_05723 [Cichorium intybus]|uniref:Uncharacterized protein n=1 Tax=Cichorium intybus TaxID=13427 RepID=A0ACB9H7K3_CICIN|nr:hypothetical protein L2E82_05723 [Cichorium intybus]
MPHDAITAPLLRSSKLDTFYNIGLRGLSVAGQLLHIPSSTFQLTRDGNAGFIVDSSTTVTRLQTEAYNTLRDAFVKGTKELPLANGVALFDTCYDFSKKKSVEVPTVSFHFSNGQKLDLPAKNYLIPVDSSGTFCFAFALTSSALSMIGNVQQQGTRVSYDLGNSLIGFYPNKYCGIRSPYFSQRARSRAATLPLRHKCPSIQKWRLMWNRNLAIFRLRSQKLHQFIH